MSRPIELEIAIELAKILKNELSQYYKIAYQGEEDEWEYEEDNAQYIRILSNDKNIFINIGVHTSSGREGPGFYYKYYNQYDHDQHDITHFLQLADPDFTKKILKYARSKF